MTIPQVSGYGNYLHPYQAYTPLQFNNWNNYGYSTPVFKSAEYQPVMQQPLSQDTVQLSAKKEIKTKKKEGLSTGAKWGIGLALTATAVIGGIALHKNIKLKNMQKSFSEIFRRDMTKEETKQLIKNYDDLMKIENIDDFCEKAFKQVKKDYGYENSNILLKVHKITDEALKKEDGGGWSLEKKTMNLRPYLQAGRTFGYNDKKSLLETLIHEFQHVKQSEIEYRTSSEKLLKILKKNNEIPTGEKLKEALDNMKKILNDNARLKSWADSRGQTVEALKKDIEQAIHHGNYKPFDTFDEKIVSKNLDDMFGSFTKLDSNSAEYQKGLKYLENEANYISAYDDEAGYMAQILEKEAYGVEKLFKNLWEWIKPIAN